MQIVNDLISLYIYTVCSRHLMVFQYCIYPKYSYRQARVNSVNPDQTSQNYTVCQSGDEPVSKFPENLDT